MVQQVSFVDNHDRFEAMKAAQQLDFPMQLPFGVAAIKFSLDYSQA